MAAKPIAVIASDTHLAPRAWVKYPLLSGDSYYSLEQIADYCVAAGLPLILAGDVFDKQRPDPTSVNACRTQLSRVADAGLGVYFTQGQHELDRDDPWLAAITGWACGHLHRGCAKIAGVSFYGIDWTPADQIRSELKLAPAVDVLVCHQVWADFMAGVATHVECSFADVGEASVLVTGDFHRHLEMVAVNGAGGKMRVLSPGSTCMQSIDEDPAKSFFVLYDDLTARSVPLKTRRCYRVRLDGKDDLDAFVDSAMPMLAEPQPGDPRIATNVVHVMYRDIPEGYDRIVRAAAGRVHLFLTTIRDEPERRDVAVDRRREFADGGLVAHLPLVADAGSRLHGDLTRLLNASDPRGEMEAMRKAFMAARANRSEQCAS